MAKKVKAVSGDTMSRLNRISPLSNFLFNALFTALALMCFLPIIFIAIISLTDNTVIRTQGYQLWLTAETISADAYTYLWSQRQTILHALWVSIYVTAIDSDGTFHFACIMNEYNEPETGTISVDGVTGGRSCHKYVNGTEFYTTYEGKWEENTDE